MTDHPLFITVTRILVDIYTITEDLLLLLLLLIRRLLCVLLALLRFIWLVFSLLKEAIEGWIFIMKLCWIISVCWWRNHFKILIIIFHTILVSIRAVSWVAILIWIAILKLILDNLVHIFRKKNLFWTSSYFIWRFNAR